MASSILNKLKTEQLAIAWKPQWLYQFIWKQLSVDKIIITTAYELYFYPEQ